MDKPLKIIFSNAKEKYILKYLEKVKMSTSLMYLICNILKIYTKIMRIMFLIMFQWGKRTFVVIVYFDEIKEWEKTSRLHCIYNN